MCQFISCLVEKITILFNSQNFWELFLATLLGSLGSGSVSYLCNKRFNKDLSNLNYKYNKELADLNYKHNKELADLNHEHNKKIFLANEYWKARTEMNRGLLAIEMAEQLLRGMSYENSTDAEEQKVNSLYHEFLRAYSNPAIQNNKSVKDALEKVKDAYLNKRHGSGTREWEPNPFESQIKNAKKLMDEEFGKYLDSNR